MTTTAPPLPTTAASPADGVAATQDAASTPSSASEVAVLTCTACGGDNALDSRFCRHCGAPLRASEVAVLPVTSTVAAAGVANNGEASPVAAAHNSVADEALHPQSVADGVDKGRAQHLVERAERLSERGELSAAILACRQAIALSPQLVSGHAILGALLEHSGDIKGAISAYEHVVELWPDSPLERERLRSLRTQAAQNSSVSFFRFDANDLFPEAPVMVAAAPERAKEAAPSEAVSSQIDTTGKSGTDSGMAGAATGATAATLAAANNGAIASSAPDPSSADLPSSATTSLAASGTPSLSPARVALPSAASLAAVPSISALPPSVNGLGNGNAVGNLKASSSATGSAPSFAPLVFDPEHITKRRWNSSYFWRAAPLAATVGTCLLFLLWAANWSAAQRNDVIVPLSDDTTTQFADNPNAANDGSVTGPARLEQGVPGGGPNVVQPGDPNVAASFGNSPSPPSPNAPSQNTGTNITRSGGNSTPASGSNGTPRTTQRSQPPFPSVRSGGQVPPLPVSPRSVVNSSNSGGGTQDFTPRMSPPQIPSAGSPPITLGNNTGGDAASTGGAPINPVYGGGRGYIRLHTGPNPGASAPTRPNNQAGSSERDASSAARSGQGSKAVNDASAAINRTGAGDPNLAFRYQSRALLFLEQGDYARAIDDFNTAIQSYQDQIARDPGDADARAGLEACRRGLKVAQRQLGR